MQVKKLLKHLKHPPIPIPARDDDIIMALKSEFEHNKRTFVFNKFKFYVDSLYCHAMPGTIEEVILTLRDLLKTSHNRTKLLNLGGGTGSVSNMIKYIGFDVYNLDIEVENEDEYNRQFDLNICDDLPYNSQSFDYILCQEVIEHVENPWKLFRDINKVLKQEGTLILTTPNIQSNYSKGVFTANKFGHFNWFRENDISFHINPLPYWEVELIASKTGFELVELKGNGKYYFKSKLTKEQTLEKNENLIFVYKKIR